MKRSFFPCRAGQSVSPVPICLPVNDRQSISLPVNDRQSISLPVNGRSTVCLLTILVLTILAILTLTVLPTVSAAASGTGTKTPEAAKATPTPVPALLTLEQAVDLAIDRAAKTKRESARIAAAETGTSDETAASPAPALTEAAIGTATTGGAASLGASVGSGALGTDASAWLTVTLTVAEKNAAALEVALAVIDLDTAMQRKTYLEGKLARFTVKAEKAEIAFKTGRIKAKDRDAAAKVVAQAEVDLGLCRLQVENGGKTLLRLTGLPVSKDFAFGRAYLLLDGSRLILPAWAAESDRASELEKLLADALTAFGELGIRIGAYVEASSLLTQTEVDFKTGKADASALSAAVAAKDEARMQALEGKQMYSACLWRLDAGLGGHLSRELKKRSSPIFF